MTNSTREKIEKDFNEKFCYEDRELRTRMQARNGISMANGLKSFIFSTIDSILAEKAEEIRKMKAPIELMQDGVRMDYSLRKGFNQALSLAQDILKK